MENDFTGDVLLKTKYKQENVRSVVLSKHQNINVFRINCYTVYLRRQGARTALFGRTNLIERLFSLEDTLN